MPFRSEAVGLPGTRTCSKTPGCTAKPPSSWEELAEMAIKANKPPDRYGFGLIAGEQNNTWFRATIFIWANDGDILSSDYKEATCNQPACVEAVSSTPTWRPSIRSRRRSPSRPNTEQMDQLFTAGKVAMHITGQYIRPRIAETAPNLQWGARPTLPRKKIAGPLGGWNYIIPKGAKNPNETWTLIEFIIQPGNIAALNNANGVFPSRKSGLQNELFTKEPAGAVRRATPVRARRPTTSLLDPAACADLVRLVVTTARRAQQGSVTFGLDAGHPRASISSGWMSSTTWSPSMARIAS